MLIFALLVLLLSIVAGSVIGVLHYAYVMSHAPISIQGEREESPVMTSALHPNYPGFLAREPRG